LARLARVVAPGIPHHVTQRGNRRQLVFFRESDYRLYLRLVGAKCRAAGVEVWAFCLMPNHVHLILVPRDPGGLRAALAEAHRRYTLAINKRMRWTGYLWQGRFSSFPMDEQHLLAATRYVEQNPVRAGLVARASDWPWSSARAHLNGRDDGIVRVRPLLDRVGSWEALLGESLSATALAEIRAVERTGRPLGPSMFVRQLESQLGRRLAPRKPGPASAVSREARSPR
jgi:REP-associated tyrosine transposase